MAANADSALAPPDIGTIWVDAGHLIRLEHRVSGLRFTPYPPHSSILAGRYGSRIRGRGLDFEDIRAYQPGDDVRNIDWKASKRAGKPLLRVYTEERDRPVLLVVDQRMTMFFGSRRAMKSVVAAEFAALAAWMAFHSGDRVGAVLFSDDGISVFRPLRSRLQTEAMLGRLADMNVELRADRPDRQDTMRLNEALKRAELLAKHDGLICIVSDFAGANEETERRLRHISAHNDVVAAMVFDPMLEAVPARSGDMAVTDSVLQMEVDFSSGHMREAIATFYRDRRLSVADMLKRSNVPLLPVNTRDETVDQLRALLGVPLQRPRFAGRRGARR